MIKFKGKFVCAVAFSVFSLFFLGCGSEEQLSNPNIPENVELNSGAVLKSENGEYNLYDYSDKYIKSETNKLVLTYDKSSSSYVYRDKNDIFAVHDNKEYKINDSDFVKIKLSPGGDYISYFINDNGMKLKVVNLKDDKDMEIESHVSISGTIYDWYDNRSLVYYGISDQGINGIFVYNIEENKEELLYKLKEGYLAYLKGSIDNILFLQLDFNNERQLILLNKDTKEIEILNDNIKEIKDVISQDDGIYFLGKVKDNVESLYKISNDTTKRVVYDFPLVIDGEKGIQTDEDGNILFIGSNNRSGNKEQIYKYSKDGSISSISDEATDYAFVDYIED